jgi:hypothetical protein
MKIHVFPRHWPVTEADLHQVAVVGISINGTLDSLRRYTAGKWREAWYRRTRKADMVLCELFYIPKD